MHVSKRSETFPSGLFFLIEQMSQKRAELRTRVMVVTGVQCAKLGGRLWRAWGPQAAWVPRGPPAWLAGAVGATCQGVMDFLVRPAGSLRTVREHAFLWGPQPISEIRCALLFVT